MPKINKMLSAFAGAVFAFAASGSTNAQELPLCDFITGGGYVIASSDGNGSFGLVAGCKNGSYFGILEYHDHGAGLDVHSTDVTGYVFVSDRTRLVCGTAKSNQFGDVNWFVFATDNGEPGAAPLGSDMFELLLTS